ncbi:hypothetical protein CHLNCDRAFT_138610 [Chlorella variabilis]|uniref:Protein kinase domain-containing protein n=1 Tax=Chlorella variabilis TaxID=554065 RepID=E1ZND9_CHLVA|nr:hypothetical protein CHLNCDRAFT_138610 [Chlorella variabilis]EFN52665.1 hypothetical protein CHLNCDRAFT_138610 [Chlorella variabilis]|eukprot:XP_005844767.1 hypothetical protein CHLNCDRAFT_138610 [Chlorella variabilis]
MRHPAASEAAACSAALTLALPLLLFLLLCASQLAAAQQQQAQQVQPQQDVAAQCPLAVRYEVSLGQGQSATPQVPIFLASLGLQNNANYSIEDWRLGWSFPFGSVIKAQQARESGRRDIFDPSIALLTPDSVHAVLESEPGANRTVIPPHSELLFNFLGTKGSGQLSPSNPYNVGALENVAFNNLRCTWVPAPAVTPSPAPKPKPVEGPAPGGNVTAAPAKDLQVEYTPIEYVGQEIVGTFTQFLVRLRNLRNTTAINMSGLGLQYWFEGPLDGAPLFADFSPQQFFTVQCEWATTGCDSLSIEVQPGMDTVPGAAFLLNITLNSKAGMLLPNSENSVPSFFLGKGIVVMDLLVTLTTKQGQAMLNATQAGAGRGWLAADYSFLDTPQLPVESANATIIPRLALPNSHIPAYLNGTLLWGAPPSPLAAAPQAEVAEAAAAAVDGAAAAMAATEDLGLPAGVTCEQTKDGQGQTCGLVVVYCCEGEEELSPFIPEEWPPALASAPTGEPAAEPLALPPPGSRTPPPPSPSSPAPAPAVDGATSPSSSPSKKSSSAGMVAGIAAGVAVAALAAGAAFFLVRRRRRRRLQQAGSAKLLLAGPQQGERGSEDGKSSTPRSPKGPRPPLFPPGGVPLGSAYKAPAGRQGVHLAEVLVNGSERGGSQQSSPSKAGSLAPLLRQAGSGGANGGHHTSNLFKFPSGVSAVSSHDNPIFDTLSDGGYPPGAAAGGSASTQQSVLPQRIGSWELQSQVVTQQAFAQAQAAGLAAAAAAAAAQQRRDEDDGWRPDVLALMHRKGATAPVLLAGRREHTRRRPREPRQRSSSGGGGSGGGSSASSSGDESEESGGGAPDLPSDWQARRSKSWDGHLQDTNSMGDSLPLFLRRHHRRGGAGDQLPHAIPPMGELAPPVLPSTEPAPGVDLNVDYATEVAPFLGRCLGTGGFGSVYEATWRGRRVAVKKLPLFGPDQPCSEGMYAAMLREIELASKFSSDRLVQVYGACTADREHVCLIMELMEGGSLHQRIYDRCKRRMGYLEILQLAHDMAAGLAYLHPSVVHRDLKPQNVLLDGEGRAKLADFGISRVKDPTKSYLSQVTNDNGTPMYMAPEQFNGSRVDEKVDVYALGVILNECYTRRQPWRDSQHFFQIILKVAINGERPWVDPDCPEPLRRLITKCWHQDPHMRPSCAEIMRLAAFMIQARRRHWGFGGCMRACEEVHRWTSLQSAGSGGGHLRLPSGARGPGGGSALASRAPSQLPPHAQQHLATPQPPQSQQQTQQGPLTPPQ